MTTKAAKLTPSSSKLAPKRRPRGFHKHMDCETARTSKIDDSTALLKDFEGPGGRWKGCWTRSWRSKSRLGVQLGTRTAQLGARMAQLGAQVRPWRSNLAREWPNLALKRALGGPTWRADGPTWRPSTISSQENPRSSERPRPHIVYIYIYIYILDSRHGTINARTTNQAMRSKLIRWAKR